MTSDIELSPLVLTVPLSLDPVLRSSTILFMVFETWPRLSRPCSKCLDPRAGLQLGWDAPGVVSPLHSFQIRCFLSPVSSGRRHPLLCSWGSSDSNPFLPGGHSCFSLVLPTPGPPALSSRLVRVRTGGPRNAPSHLRAATNHLQPQCPRLVRRTILRASSEHLASSSPVTSLPPSVT